MKLAHGWRLTGLSTDTKIAVKEFLRPAVRSVPPSLAERLGPCHIVLSPSIANSHIVSQWSAASGGLRVELATAGVDAHDLAMELLVCLGQAVWETASAAERRAYYRLLRAEFDADVNGEIDEDALEEKRVLLSSRTLARSARRLERYAGVSFASTIAEYVHSLWHDVSVRSGPEHLPGPWLRRRLEMLARWFPPGRGQRLFSYV